MLDRQKISEVAKEIIDWITFNVIRKSIERGRDFDTIILDSIFSVHNSVQGLGYEGVDFIEIQNLCHENLSDYIKSYSKKENIDTETMHHKLQLTIDERMDLLEEIEGNTFVSRELEILNYILEEHILEYILLK